MEKMHKWEHSVLDELDSAKDYAEKYLYCKSEGDTSWANRYKEMANDELKHASYLQELALSKVQKMKATNTITVDDEDDWKTHTHNYNNCVAHIKILLSM